MKKDIIHNGGNLILRENWSQWGEVEVITTSKGLVYTLDWDELQVVHAALGKYIEKTKPKIAELEERVAAQYA